MSLLYKSCDLLLFPSLYEGFGMPCLEAMKCGLPVVSSNNGSLKEVVNIQNRFNLNNQNKIIKHINREARESMSRFSKFLFFPRESMSASPYIHFFFALL